ncbi:hypothetical protein COV24_04585 [candidate division WWE3 bacterium CG10_big_fil_rev_8_21_14_0_10_32_10]|uniref:Uncharacterized protein n=1 Tax=candidate division WWE3 bacterium CG10_big_fil_rev_8_21_14_0_10_32_10 TaxID=1975090 RepID=A0A2H0R976_UNCKA|nr:MAG: hypothetical protein COV24_04585 [candidate division WWE3 bacterium CG10_big_fil_rev_8_21_14_0_10_32_10]
MYQNKNPLKGNLELPSDINLKKIDVIAIFKFGDPSVYKIKYKGKEYKVEKTGIHYTQQVGNTLYHNFGLVSEGTFFKISFNTKTLNWRLLEESQNSI